MLYGEIQINIYAPHGAQSDRIYQALIKEIQHVLDKHDCDEFRVNFAQVEEAWPIMRVETVTDGYGAAPPEVYIEEWVR